MRIALVGPVTPTLLKLGNSLKEVPSGHQFPFISHLANEYATRGHDVSLITLNAGRNEFFEAIDGRISLRMVPFRGKRAMLDLFRQERRDLAAAISSCSFDIVHAHWLYEYALAALSVDHRAIITMHDSPEVVFQYNPSFYRLAKLLMSRLTLHRAAAITVPSPYLAAIARRGFSKPVSVIPNGIPLALLGKGPRLRGRGLTILSVNNGFDRRKNVGVLIDAVANIALVEPAVKLQLVGEGFERGGAAERYARRVGAFQNIEFFGRQSSSLITDLMDAADLYVHPSKEESFGMVLVEAMARGLPVIGGKNSGAVPWVLGGAGSLVDVSSATLLAASILTTLRDSVSWERFSELSFERASVQFSIPAVADLYLEKYRELLID